MKKNLWKHQYRGTPKDQPSRHSRSQGNWLLLGALGSENCKKKKNMMIIIIMLWHFSMRTGHEIEARRLDLLMIDKRENNCQIIK